jgi:hypothetical protein
LRVSKISMAAGWSCPIMMTTSSSFNEWIGTCERWRKWD